jgi:hypothetical protein
MAIAGRLQKPVLPFMNMKDLEESAKFEAALLQNHMNAAYTALFLCFGKVDPITLDEFFQLICAFSYKGDIRMRFKMENP